MKFHKGTFVIQNIPDAPEPAQVVCGWIEESNTFGFFKYRNYWKATDLMSGTLVTTQPTRKACAEWIIENTGVIEKRKTDPKYRLMVESFRQKLKEALSEGE